MGMPACGPRPELVATSPRFARKRAKLSGDTRYFSGRPCKAGHIADRWTSSGTCVECFSDTNAWHRAHPGAQRRTNPDRYSMYKAKRRAAERSPAWAVPLCINAIYSIARRLREAGLDVNVDHAVPLQGKRVSGLHVRENLQIITASENFRKHNKFVVV